MMTESFDVIVIGGGAAGTFAAITAASGGAHVLLLERNSALGRKLLITGKGRCNVTNNCTAEEVLRNVPRNGRFLYSALNAFPPEKTMAFFEAHGCPLKTERGNRVFPESDRSQSIVNCLSSEVGKCGIAVRTERAETVLREDNRTIGVKTDRAVYSSGSVIIATGGLSYPATGSTGDGYAMAQKLGHTIIPQQGSLVPLEISGNECAQMQGLSLRNTGVKLVDSSGKKLYQDFGELLFTHFGVSGPTVLSASCHIKGEGCRLLLDLKPALDEGKLDARILRDMEMYRNRSMENALTDLLPRSLIPVMLARCGITPELQANSLTRVQRRELVNQIKSFALEIRGKRPVEEAIITSGGVRVSQIDPKTMESKLAAGVFFCGEILDCDAYTGGFNLQIAWSTGYLAGLAAQKRRIDKSGDL